MMKGFTITEMRDRSQATGHHYFDRDNMKFAAAMFHGPANDVGLFVASTQFVSYAATLPRLYDVMRFNLATGKVESVGEGYKTLAAAREARTTLTAELRKGV